MMMIKVRAEIEIEIEAQDGYSARRQVRALIQNGTIKDAFSEIDAEIVSYHVASAREES